MIHRNLSFAEYQQIDAVNASFLKDFAKRTPRHAKWRLDHPQEPTEAMALGSLEHTIVLEPKTMQEKYHVIEQRLPRNTKPGKEQELEVQKIEQETGKTVIYRNQLITAYSMANSVKDHLDAGELVEAEGDCELTIINEFAGIPVKCRIDKLCKDLTAVDLKTTKDASERGFSRTMNDFRYDMQAAWYKMLLKLEGIEAKDFVFIAVESEPPYCVATHSPVPRAMHKGQEDCLSALKAFGMCRQHNQWFGYPQHRQQIDLPPYAYMTRSQLDERKAVEVNEI